MRVLLKTSRNMEVISYDYQYDLMKLLHKWLGRNRIHDEISLYSFSWLMGAKRLSNGLNFPDGSIWFISFWDDKNIKKVISGILDDPDMFSGMEVKEVVIQETPHFKSEERFFSASPILIRKYDDNGVAKYVLFDNPESGVLMTETLNSKF